LNALKDARVLTEAALAIALAFVLGLIVLFRMPLGGSISLEMVPLILLALRQGWKVGMLAGAAYGLLNLAINPVILHPIQVLFDYPLPFAALGLAGFFSPTVRGAVVGTVVAVLARFVFHFVSGIVFFASYAPEGWDPLVYSGAYNAAYLLPSLIVALIAVPLLLRPLSQAQPSRREQEFGTAGTGRAV
jgi:thiamine transporter